MLTRLSICLVSVNQSAFVSYERKKKKEKWDKTSALLKLNQKTSDYIWVNEETENQSKFLFADWIS